MIYSMPIPQYPEFAAIDLDMRADLYPALNMTKDGISELTFSNLYLFRHVYDYRVSLLPGGSSVVEGTKAGKSFFYLPCCFPDQSGPTMRWWSCCTGGTFPSSPSMVRRAT